LKNVKDWRKYCKSGEKPVDIPVNPDREYKTEWVSWGDWLETNAVASQKRQYLPFEEARVYVQSLRLTSGKEFKDYMKKARPLGIPYAPWQVYEEWKGMSDWLGVEVSRYSNRNFLPFEEAREYVHKLGLKTSKEWREYCGSGKLPNIPTNPEKKYKEDWINIGDWLGTGNIGNKDRKFLPFEEAREYVHKLGLRTVGEWESYRKSGKLPQNIPTTPRRTYPKEGWRGFGDWLGTDAIAPQNKQYLPFNEAREFVHALKLRSQSDWFEYCRSGKPLQDIPIAPHQVYQNEWVDWGDWLGTGTKATQQSGWSIQKVKELIRDLIKNKVIDEWSEDERYHLLLAKGVLNLGSNRFSKLLQDLIVGPKTQEQRKALEDFANSDYENAPDLADEKIQTVSTEKLAELVDEEGQTDPLDIDTTTPKQILTQTEYLESICQDVELMQFFVNHFVSKLWTSVFRDEKKGSTVNEVRKEVKTGKKFHDTVTEIFLSQYDAMEKLETPKGYSFSEPRLMQLYVAYKVKSQSSFGNFSGTGAGKTLSAILASRVIESKMTLVVCPNDVVRQWAIEVLKVFPDSKIITGKPAFDARYDEAKHQYLVLNYDKFSQPDSQHFIRKLVKEKIDFVVLDEIQFIKRRHNVEESHRRQNLGFLLTRVRKKNSEVKVLGMSATPVINHLEEGKSLLEYMTGKIYADIAVTATVPNAMSLHQKLSTISIREMPKYKSDIQIHNETEVYAEKPQDISQRNFAKNILLIEQLLTAARIPEIIKKIKGQTIIYTEYVTGIISQLSEAVENAGFSYAEYSGNDHSGLERFREKQVQVLIASRPVSIGVDGLQEVCNNLIINTLPWTHAQYQQLIGRLHRLGQKNDVIHVHIIKASIARWEYDQYRWNRIEFKRTLADCAVDGRFPRGILQTKEKMQMELIRWLERLERNEIYTFERRNLNVELTPTQRQQYLRNTNEFSKLNKIINTSKSETTHERIELDPQFLVKYHEKLDETRKGWNIDPVNVIANKINELKLPAHIIMKLVIGDFGCGKGKLMELLKENKMYSFDHHNIINEKIIPCNMKSVPVKDGGLDIAVFSLSIMGENWSEYILEAKRCLTRYGTLMIAETTKSLSGRLSELRNIIKQQGFEIYKDEERSIFTFIEARKL
jgi:superfamily II DNA or RNA helicase